MRVGADTTSLAVPSEGPMGGYAGRTRPSAGWADPLEVAVVYASDGSRTAVLVVLDLVAVNPDLVSAVRQAVSDAVPVDPRGILVAATHTHAGPAVDLRPGGGDTPEGLVTTVSTTAAEAASRAAAERRPVGVRAGRTHVEAVGGVRHRAEPVPRPLPLDVAVFEAPEATTILASFPCHPTVLGADNRLLSADLAGAWRRLVREEMPSDGTTHVVALTGAAGDISTRPTRRERTPAEARHLGARIADAAVELIPRATRLDGDAAVSITRDRLPLPLRDGAPAGPSRAALEAARDEASARDDTLAERHAATALQGQQLGARWWAALDGPVIAEVSVFALGPVRVVGIPGEAFLELGEAVRDRIDGPALICGYADGYVGYLPTRDAYDTHPEAYEVQISVLAPDAGRRLVDGITALPTAT